MHYIKLISYSRYGYTDTVHLLLNHGADVSASNNDGRTALMQAAQGGHVGTVSMLLKMGADVNARNDKYRYNMIQNKTK